MPFKIIYVNPEAQPNEVCIGNILKDMDFNSLDWKTKRKGKNAIMLNGQVSAAHVPIFVKRTELEEKGFQIVGS